MQKSKMKAYLNCQVPQIQQNSRFVKLKLSLLLTIQARKKNWLIWETFRKSELYHL